MAKPHGHVVVGPTLAMHNHDLLVAKPHTLMGVGAILAVQGEARVHHKPLEKKFPRHSEQSSIKILRTSPPQPEIRHLQPSLRTIH